MQASSVDVRKTTPPQGPARTGAPSPQGAVRTRLPFSRMAAAALFLAVLALASTGRPAAWPVVAALAAVCLLVARRARRPALRNRATVEAIRSLHAGSVAILGAGLALALVAAPAYHDVAARLTH